MNTNSVPGNKYDDEILTYRLRKNKITSNGAIILFDSLKRENIYVHSVHLNENQLDDQCIKSIGEYIKDNSSLNELDLENNLITDEGVKMLTKYLFGNTTLKTLGLACNKKITNKSYSILVDVCQMTKIEDLNTFGTLITGRKLLDIQYIKSISSGTLEILDVQAL